MKTHTRTHNGTMPKYRQIEQDLREKIARGDWPAGSTLPGRRSLAATYGVTHNTLDRAIASLVADQLLSTDAYGTRVRGELAPAPQTVPLMLGIIVPTIDSIYELNVEQDYTIPPIIRAIERRCAREQTARIRYAFLNCDEPAQRHPIKDAIAQLRTEGVNAFIIIDIFEPYQLFEEMMQTVDTISDPVVFISSRELVSSYSCMSYDNRLMGYQAAEHLLQSGYRDLLFLSPYSLDWVQQRYEGMCLAAAHAGVAREAINNIIEHPGPVKTLRLIARAEERFLQTRCRRELFLPGPAGLRGIVAVNDAFAQLLMARAAEHGLKAGRDYGIIGFDDLPSSRPVGLTSLGAPMEKLGEEAAEIIIRTRQQPMEPVHMRILAEFSPRASTYRG